MQTIGKGVTFNEAEAKRIVELDNQNRIKMELMRNPILSKYDQVAMYQEVQRNTAEMISIEKKARIRNIGLKVVKGEG